MMRLFFKALSSALAGIVTFVAISAVAPSELSAQAGVLRGTVTDSAGRPLRGVEIISINTNRSARTNADGRYTLTRLQWGQQVIMARLPGFRPSESAVNMLDENTPDKDFQLFAIVQAIDTVRITSHDGCAAYDYAGFECRRKAGIGQFRGEAEIKALRPLYWADMFEGLDGFRKEPYFNTVTASQDWTVASVTGWRCLMEGWNGRHKQAADELTRTADIVAIEHYDVYEKVPAAYKRLAWPNGQDKPCALIMYWTRGFIDHEISRRR